MFRLTLLAFSITSALALTACSDDADDGGSPASGGAAGSASGGTSSGGSGGTSTGGSAGTSTGGSAGAATGGTAGTGGATTCTSATETLLGVIDEVSEGVVEVIDDASGTKTLYVDASAGGFTQAAQNPYIYLDLAGAAKVSITDPASLDASSWDLALKRDVIRTNSADSGSGSGGALRVTGKAFDAVTAADATGTFETDDFMDNECNPQTDQTGKPLTAFTEWYDYDPTTMHLDPKVLVFIVKGANGTALYKLQLLDYYAAADGGMGAASAFYSIKVAAL